jgi:hypothetical protein
MACHDAGREEDVVLLIQQHRTPFEKKVLPASSTASITWKCGDAVPTGSYRQPDQKAASMRDIHCLGSREGALLQGRASTAIA